MSEQQTWKMRFAVAIVLALATWGGSYADETKPLTPEERAKLKKEYEQLNKMGVLLEVLGQPRQALPFYERALAMHERLYDKKDHPDLATSLNNLGLLLNALGQPRQALPYAERALAMQERLYGKKDHPDLATCLNNMGANLQALGQSRQALPFFERALAMRERLHDKKDHPELATCLNNMGFLLEVLGQSRQALPFYERALAMTERLHDKKDHPDLAMSLNNMGAILDALGQPRQALPFFERALAMRERLYGKKDHPELATSLNNIGALLAALGQPRQALPFYERALAMRERLYDKKDHPELARSLSNMGGLLQALGQSRQALPFHERALAMTERLHDKKDHPELATSLNNMGVLLQALGQPRQALPFQERALAMCERLYDRKDHPDLARSLNNLGVLLDALGQPGQALRFYERALAMYERLCDKKDHPDLARSLNTMGVLLAALGQPRQALPFQERALAMRERLYDKKDHPELARSLNNMGGLLQALGQSRQAMPFFERALAMTERLHDKKDHPELANSLSNMGFLLQALGQPGQALPYCERALATSRRLVDNFARFAPEPRALDFAQQHTKYLNAVLGLTVGLEDNIGYRAVWDGRAAVTRILQARHQAARAALDPAARQTWQALADTRRQLDALLRQTDLGPDERTAELRRLEADKDRLQRELAALLPEFAIPDDAHRPMPEHLLQKLPKASALLDLVRYRKLEIDPNKPGLIGATVTPAYAGFVLAPGQPIRRVELGPAAPIDAAVAAWLRALDDWQPDATSTARRDLARQAEQRGRALRRLVWDRLAAHLPAGTTTVYVAPDGDLTRVPWAALPADEPDSVLLDRITFAVVPHAPFLLERLSSPHARDDQPGRLLAVGDVAYGSATTAPGGSYSFLKYTQKEVEQVVRRATGRPTLTLQGSDAATTRLLTELPRARYVHLATHGFFNANDLTEERQRLAKQMENLRGYIPPTSGNTEFGGVGLRSPLVYTGLVLAGANQPAKTGSDGGIVTGEALIELPLEGMRLCVLSACETGLGALTEGEGVQGLVRSFHLAGCRDVVASLWKVDDAATAALMALFYEELWVKGTPPLEALSRAHRTLSRHPERIAELSGLRGAGNPALAVKPTDTGTGPSTTPVAPGPRLHPKLWAAFQLHGAGR